MPPEGFEPAASASGRPQTLALDRSATNSILRPFSPWDVTTGPQWDLLVWTFGRGPNKRNAVHVTTAWQAHSVQ